MEYRELGRTGWNVSTISFGAWAIGAEWGSVSDRDSLAALRLALDKGVNLFDTADVYGDGRSERLLGQLRRERQEPFYIATKAGRRLNPHAAEGYNRNNLRRSPAPPDRHPCQAASVVRAPDGQVRPTQFPHDQLDG